jgi:low affinity Fe/Cu permease
MTEWLLLGFCSVSVLVCVCLLLQQQDTINEDIVEIDDKMDTLKTHLKSTFGSQVLTQSHCAYATGFS